MPFFNTILDIVFGVKCISCGKSGQDLCAICISNFRFAERESAEWIFPIFDYRDPSLKSALWFFKYKGKKNLARIFAELIYEKILEELSDLTMLDNFINPILIPIPLSPKRYRERGYNQTELICKELIKINNVRKNVLITLEKNILIKPIETKHQAHIENRKERLENIVGSFSIKNAGENISKIKNRNIILIDDITTTGATLTEAKKILKKSGARKVIAFTIAH